MSARVKVILCMIVLAALFLGGCKRGSSDAVELVAYPVDSTEGVLTRSGVESDTEISADGNGSLRLTAAGPTTFRLFDTGDIDIEDARLVYRAKLRTDDVDGRVYLEMWCRFPGRGEFFSRALHAPLSGSVDWTEQETPFFLKKGENPDNVTLNLVIDGTGTAWIDDIRLMRGPL
jgi:hypothetical protein